MASPAIEYGLGSTDDGRTLGGDKVSGSEDRDAMFKAANIVPLVSRSVRWWCIGSIAASVVAPIATLYVYSTWAFSHYEETANRYLEASNASADRYEKQIDRLISGIDRSIDANTREISLLREDTTKQLSGLRDDVVDVDKTLSIRVDQMDQVPTLSDIKGVFEEAVGKGYIPANQSSQDD